MNDLIARLEAAVARLEQMAETQVKPSSESKPINASAVVSVAETPRMLVEWDRLVSDYLVPVERCADELDGVVKQQFAHFKAAVDAERKLMELAHQCKKADVNDLPSLIMPIQEEIAKVIQIKDAHRSSLLFNHLCVLAESIPALGWVVVEPTPAPYIGDMKDAALFYINRVIKEYKDKEKVHVDYVNTLKEFLIQLQAYVKAHHTTGLSWNPKGGDAKSFKSTNVNEKTTASIAAPGLPPPPPPPPTASQLEAFASKSAPAKPPANASLFAELNKANVTANLRKVDKSEMTHKNPALRKVGTVSEATSKNSLDGKFTFFTFVVFMNESNLTFQYFLYSLAVFLPPNGYQMSEPASRSARHSPRCLFKETNGSLRIMLATATL